MKEISIIGATSPLGTRLVERLAEQEYKVFATYRAPERIPGSWAANAWINPIRLDLPERSDLHNVYKRQIVWLAHLHQGRFNGLEKAANLEPFLRFLNEARNGPVEQITFISSGGSVYGEAKQLPIPEDHPREPLSSYGKTKKAMEDALIDFGRNASARIAIIRPGNIYGFEFSGSRAKGIVGTFLNSVSARSRFTLINEGKTVRDFIHVDDVCRAITCAIQSDLREVIWNAGTGIPTRIFDLLEQIVHRSGVEMPEMIHQPNYRSDVETNILSIDKILRESDWAPQINLDAGIDIVVEDWREKLSGTASSVC